MLRMSRANRVKGIDAVTSYVARRFTAARSSRGLLERTLQPSLAGYEVLNGPDGYQIANAARITLEQEIAKACNGFDALVLFAAARSISPRIWTLLGPSGDDVQVGVRAVLELGIQKYAKWKPSTRQLENMPGFLPAHLEVLGKVFALSEAYAGMLATLRRLAKGQRVEVRCVAPLELVNEESDVGELIARLDRRHGAEDDPLASFGTVADSLVDEMPIPFLLAAALVAPSEVLTTARGDFAVETLETGRLVRTADRVTRWGFIGNLQHFQRSVEAYDAALRDSVGFGLIDLHAVEHLSSIAILERYGGPESLPDCLVLLGLVPLPEEASILYEAVAGTHPYDEMDMDHRPTPESLSRAFDHLVASPTLLDLTNPTVRRPLSQISPSKYVCDLTAVSLFSPLWVERGLSEDQRQKLTRGFEWRAHTMLSRLGEQPWTSGRVLKAGSHVLTDVDASVQIGDLLVVGDCYSSPWSHELDVGTHSKVRNRAQALVAKAEKWQRQWREIATDYSSLLPAGVGRILPVVLTASAEWVPSLDAHLWLSDEVPIILTANELIDVLTASNPPTSSQVLRVAAPT
jgi:hypothetical protein